MRVSVIVGWTKVVSIASTVKLLYSGHPGM